MAYLNLKAKNLAAVKQKRKMGSSKVYLYIFTFLLLVLTFQVYLGSRLNGMKHDSFEGAIGSSLRTELANFQLSKLSRHPIRVIKSMPRYENYPPQSNTCDRFYSNKDKIRAFFPLFWLGETLPAYLYSFLYSMQNHSFIDLNFIMVDFAENECASFSVPAFLQNATNIMYSCVSTDSLAYMTANAICSEWTCMPDQKETVAKFLKRRWITKPYSWADFKPLFMHIMRPYVSNCYSHWIFGDGDTYHGSYQSFNFELLKAFDILSVGPHWDPTIFLRGQLTFLKNTDKIVKLYKHIKPFKTFAAFHNWYEVMYLTSNMTRMDVIDEGYLTREMLRDPSVSFMLGPGQIGDDQENSVFAFVQKGSNESFLLDIKKNSLKNVANVTALSFAKKASVADLLAKAVNVQVIYGNDCKGFFWAPEEAKQCVDGSLWAEGAVFLRPPVNMRHLAPNCTVEANSLCRSIIPNIFQLDGAPGVEAPYLIHFMQLKQKYIDFDFSNLLPSQLEERRVFYIYGNKKGTVRTYYHGQVGSLEELSKLVLKS